MWIYSCPFEKSSTVLCVSVSNCKLAQQKYEMKEREEGRDVRWLGREQGGLQRTKRVDTFFSAELETYKLTEESSAQSSEYKQAASSQTLNKRDEISVLSVLSDLAARDDIYFTAGGL